MSALIVLLIGLTPAYAAPPPGDDQGGGSNQYGSSNETSNRYVSSYQVPNDIEDAAQAEIEALNPPTDGRYVDMPNLNVPVVHNGELVGYAFVIVRFRMPQSASEWQIRDVSHIMLDKLVKASHIVPFELTDRDEFDTSATHDAWLVVAGQVVDSNIINDIEIIGRDIRFLGL